MSTMKPALYLSLLAPLLIYVGCADEEAPPGPMPGAGGTQAQGGVKSTGGTTGTTGGTTTGTTGGTTTGTTGGMTGTTGGTVAMGGSGGQATGGMAGKAATGGMSGGGISGGGAGAGGTSTGGGGASNAGMNNGGGGASTAGMGGTGGAKTDLPTPATLAPGLDGHLITTPCKANPNFDDCDSGGWRSSAVNNFAANACVGPRLEALINFPVAGVPGTTYDVTMHFYGVMEPRQYSNVTREATGDPNLNGGTPTPWAEANAGANVYTAGDNNYNTYELHVYDQNDMMVRQYFMNSDNGTGHYTMLIDYEKTIKVIGGGEVRLRVFDANCRMIKNCGASGQWPCANKARTVDVADASPAPPAAQLMQPGLGLAPEEAGQWWLIDVTNVAAAAAP
jgi:hypothetical protein